METLDAIRKRCSLKAHVSGRAIEPEKIQAVLTAGQLAASARNLQPWRFLVVQQRETLDSLVQALWEANRVISEAPVILVACARASDDISKNGKEYYLFDVGLAVGNMVVAATDLGLVTHLMTAFDEEQVKKVLHIPSDVQAVVITPLAYPLEATYDEAAHDRLSQRTRKSLEELVYWDQWSEPEPA